MIIHFSIIGSLLILLALSHVVFPWFFNWQEELKRLSLINRQIMTIHTFFIAFVVFLLGLLCLSSGEDLINTVLGRRVCLGMGIFWAIRLFIQFFGYSSILWRGKRFETMMHLIFTVLFAYMSVVFLLAGL
ncbi:hypothetical protein [Chitinophaga sancti]|uniref:Uncharacterized protein n=1 Tax=Chitinophaga sancti TaxID=1004 RepID=A0A1K1SY15_9BACT|nr:hypothetical protein [Chitinophaga sancti]WQD62277.1 hypothetical protein U0033_30765 [Chitinophaga sancti]WQG92154.1 hypothetical protein SR876_11620 [Chitinophaga sancti]SFW88959.1 hypothetical protein SAMN05661012_06344 [Chitinophaga sancti]